MLRQIANALKSFGRRGAHVAMSIVAIIFVAATQRAAAQGSAPSVANAVQGFSNNRDQPVRIEAASLEMREKKKEATFSGNVKVVQGDTTMTSKTLVAFYGSDAPSPSNAKKSAPMRSTTPGPGGSSSIRRLEARGDVTVTQKDQTVTGKTAIFDTRANLITMAGGVVLTQCRNVMRGDRLLVDMTTGISRVESDSRKVQVLVEQSSGSGCGAPSAPPLTSVPAPKR